MIIGLPSALVNIFYRTFWVTFFEGLGLDVVESDPTNKHIINIGVKNAVPELCVPVKIYLGHFLDLVDKVDFVYVPRLMSIRKGDTFCPKFLGLPDMIRHQFPQYADKMLTHHIHSDGEDIGKSKTYFKLGMKLINNRRKVKQAIKKGQEKWRAFRNLCHDGYNCRQAEAQICHNKTIKLKNHNVKIALLGYVYNVYDDYISMDIINKLENMGANTVTFEMISLSDTEKQLKEKLRKDIFWTFSNKLFAAGYHFFEDPTVDGVIHITAFGCGPDSFLGKILEFDSDKHQKPFMTVRVDEHTGESHLLTRIEAFVDMIVRKKGM